MKAGDVMTRDVVTIDPDRTIREVAQLLLDRRISAVPVVEQSGRMVGLVSETDLLRRVEATTERRRAGWRALIASSSRMATEYAKSHARCASDVMTRNVVTAHEDTPLNRVADLLEDGNIRRVPVVRDGVVVGIVSRADLLRALLAAKPEDVREIRIDDEAILSQLKDELRGQRWARSKGVQITVKNGVVGLSGSIFSQAERHALRIAAERIPGVQSVDDQLTPVEAPGGI